MLYCLHSILWVISVCTYMAIHRFTLFVLCMFAFLSFCFGLCLPALRLVPLGIPNSSNGYHSQRWALGSMSTLGISRCLGDPTQLSFPSRKGSTSDRVSRFHACMGKLSFSWLVLRLSCSAESIELDSRFIHSVSMAFRSKALFFCGSSCL